jgi:hypothetical protein
MPGNQTLVAMKRADGTIDSVVHLDAVTVKPDATGVVQIPSQFVMSMITTHVP